MNTKIERGAASIFVVIFTMLIVATITVGFTAIMIRDQVQSSATDLSQSAYDSSLAGVEDAKRSIIKFNTQCKNGTDLSTPWCQQAKVAFEQCNSNSVILHGAASTDMSERQISTSTSGSDKELDQAYTCVKTNLNTPDYIGQDLADGQQVFIPLASGEEEFNALRISWFSRSDLSTGGTAVNRPNPVTDPNTAKLYPNVDTQWPGNRPPVLRAQYIQTSNSFRLTDFDENEEDDGELRSNTNSVFMYPTKGTSGSSVGVLSDLDVRHSSTVSPWQVACAATVADGNYACTAYLKLPKTIDDSNKTEAYLTLRPFYNKTSYKVEMLQLAPAADTSTSTVVYFKGVQPEVDSTGRTNDVFRRVSSRVETISGSNNIFPVGALEVRSNLCKDFAVTDAKESYNSGNCNPVN